MITAYKHVTLIHGILTRLSRPDWTEDFQAYCARHGLAVTWKAEHYFAPPFPTLTTGLINPYMAKGLARRITLVNQSARQNPVDFDGLPICLVGHSNGADIAIRTCWELARLGQKVETLILIAGAVQHDIHESGLAELIDEGHVGRVFAYWNAADIVVKPLELPFLKRFMASWGALGARGLASGISPTGQHLRLDERLESSEVLSETQYFNRNFEGYGHNGYFAEGNISRTFSALVQDLGLQSIHPIPAPAPKPVAVDEDDFPPGVPYKD